MYTINIKSMKDKLIMIIFRNCVVVIRNSCLETTVIEILNRELKQHKDFDNYRLVD